MAWWKDLAPRQETTPNKSGRMIEVRGVVLHIAQGTYEGTISWCKNPRSQVSAHFVCGKNKGERCQMVDTDYTAWTQGAGNGRWLSIEFAGHSGERLTEHQLDFAAQILARAHQVYGVPLQSTDSPNGRGLGWHGMGGAAWGNHPNCPGQPILAQRPEIIARAKQIAKGGNMAITDADARRVWRWDPNKDGEGIGNPWSDAKTNPTVMPVTALTELLRVAVKEWPEVRQNVADMHAAVKRIEDRTGTGQLAIDYGKIADLVAARLADHLGSKVADELAAALLRRIARAES